MLGFKELHVDCFYDGQSVKKSKDEKLFEDFSKHCIDIVKGRMVRAAMKLNLTYTAQIGSTRETRTLPVVDSKSIIKHFTQKETITERDQRCFYYIIHGSFESNWDIQEETTLMQNLGYVYNRNVKEMGMLKGDIAKLVSQKKQDQVKNLRKAICATHPSLDIQVTRVDMGTEYEKNRKEQGIFYLKPVPENKVREVI